MPENLLGRIDFHSVQVIIPGLFTAIQPHSITAALLAGFCPQTLNALFFRVELIQTGLILGDILIFIFVSFLRTQAGTCLSHEVSIISGTAVRFT